MKLYDTLTRHAQARRAGRARGRQDVHVRPHRVPRRPHRQPALVPDGRLDPPRAGAPGPARAPRQEHHRRRPHAPGGAGAGRGQGDRGGPGGGEDTGGDRRDVHRAVPAGRREAQHRPGEPLPEGHGPHRRDAGDRRGPGRQGPRLRGRRQRLLQRPGLTGLRRALRQRPGRGAAGGCPDRGRPAQTGRARLHAVEGGRAGTRAEVAQPVGRRLPRLAHRVLGHVDQVPRAALRHPHRRRRQHIPPPRGRDRPERGVHRRPGGRHLGTRPAPARRRREDGQVDRQLVHTP